jgi:Lar family restriction alleviation protein
VEDEMNEELKPCPFCGSDKISIVEVILKQPPPHYQVFCIECGCGTQRYSYYALPNKETAIIRWNKRILTK